jgi:hypothetical protein
MTPKHSPPVGYVVTRLKQIPGRPVGWTVTKWKKETNDA